LTKDFGPIRRQQKKQKRKEREGEGGSAKPTEKTR